MGIPEVIRNVGQDLGLIIGEWMRPFSRYREEVTLRQKSAPVALIHWNGKLTISSLSVPGSDRVKDENETCR